MIPQALLRRDITPTATKVYFALRSYVNRKTGQCNPRYATIARRIGLSERTVCRALRELRLAGWIGVRRGHWGSNYECRNRAIPATDGGYIRATDGVNIHDKHGVYQQLHLFTEPDVVLNQKSATAADAQATGSEHGTGRAAASAPVADADQKPNTNTRPRSDAERLVADLIPEHPEPGAPDRAVAEAEKILEGAADPVEAYATARCNHEAWRAHWAKLDPHRFIPQLWRWFASGEWKFAPAERKGVARETWSARLKRESDESDQSYYRTLAEHEAWDLLREYGQDPEVWRAKVEAA
jgi:hypothetical protein